MDQPVDNGFTDHRVFKQLKPALGLDLGSDDERGFRGLLDSRLRLLDIADKSVVIGKP